jgi:hypothetical protein
VILIKRKPKKPTVVIKPETKPVVKPKVSSNTNDVYPVSQKALIKVAIYDKSSRKQRKS